MKKLNDPNTKRAEALVSKWPKWKREYQLTKHRPNPDKQGAEASNKDQRVKKLRG